MTQYINKSALVAEIKDKINLYEEAFKDPSFASYEACLIAKGKYRKLLDILQFINSLKVKEVDFEKEVDIEDAVHGTVDYPIIGCDFPNIYPNYKELKEYCDRKGIKDNDKVKLIIIKDVGYDTN